METALVIGAIVAVSLVCPVMMWLGRRGNGPGCGMEQCRPKKKETADRLRSRQEQLLAEIERLERERVR